MSRYRGKFIILLPTIESSINRLHASTSRSNIIGGILSYFSIFICKRMITPLSFDACRNSRAYCCTKQPHLSSFVALIIIGHKQYETSRFISAFLCSCKFRALYFGGLKMWHKQPTQFTTFGTNHDWTHENKRPLKNWYFSPFSALTIIKIKRAFLKTGTFVLFSIFMFIYISSALF